MRLFLATGEGLAVVTRRGGRSQVATRLPGLHTQCLATDPQRPEVVYCGTFGQGLWKSVDGGDSWNPVGDGIAHAEVMAVAVEDKGTLWAGTEPSALFRSEDGGRSWQERPTLQEIPSHATWSFPPRPWTHHVRWIQPDPVVEERLYVAIELGGVMKSVDGGLTWEDRKPGAKLDAHTLRAHRLAPGRVYEAAGDGYGETADAGATWQPGDQGLQWRYLWGLAVDPADPEVVMVSVSPGPRHAHGGSGGQQPRAVPGMSGPPPWAGYGWNGPESWLYRRTGAGPWQPVTDGLPEARGTLAYVLATHEAEPHVFYASPRSDAVYRSADGGASWEALPLGGPARRVNALAVAAID
jgi:hypothetical protein